MGCKVDNAIILAAGTASRFVPLSYERPKALFDVKGEILIERQIRQLKEAGIPEIIVVTGYKQEAFQYLGKLYGVKLIYNPEYATRNNNGSIYVVKDFIRNTYICSSDNYFQENPFEAEVAYAYYAAVYAEGYTNEWCMQEDSEGYIRSVTIGGADAWYMLGHAFWNEEFSNSFLAILEKEYDKPMIKGALWESIYVEHINELKLKMRKYKKEVIYEFDTLEELRQFDKSYMDDSRSSILNKIAVSFGCQEREIVDIALLKETDDRTIGFTFHIREDLYEYYYNTGTYVKKEEGNSK